MSHKILLEEAKTAIDNLYGDSSVSRQQTLESLEELEEKIGELIVIIEDEIKNEEEV